MIDLKYGKRQVINYRGAKKVIGGLTAKNKISILLYIAKELANIDNREVLAGRILELCAEIFEPDNVTLRIHERGLLKVVAFLKETTPPRRDLKPGEGFSGEAFQTGNTCFYADLKIHPDLIDNEEKTRCVICVPIPGKNKAKGTISIESNTDHFYVRDDIEILEAMASQVALALEKVELVSGLLDATHKLESDMRMGRNVQDHIVNQYIKPWNGIYSSAFYVPMVEVSGDYFDVVAHKEHMTVLMVDVSGHGVPAALITMVIHFQFRRLIDQGLDVLELITELNRQVKPKLPLGTYFTAQIMRINNDLSYTFTNGGHQPVLHIQTNSHELLDTAGFPLGIPADGEYELKTGYIRPGDYLVFSSDGFHEQKDENGKEPADDEFEQSMIKLLYEVDEPDHGERVQAVLKTFTDNWQKRIGNAPIDDDLSLLILHAAPGLPDAVRHYNMASRIRQEGNDDAAVAEGLKAYRLEPSLIKNLRFLARRYYSLGEYEECNRFIHEYIDLTGDLQPEILFLMGMAYFKLDRFDEARIQFTRALTGSPGYCNASIMLSRCYRELDDIDAARETIQRALAITPRDTNLLAAQKKLTMLEAKRKTS